MDKRLHDTIHRGQRRAKAMTRQAAETWSELPDKDKKTIGYSAAGGFTLAALLDELVSPLMFLLQIGLIVGVIFSLASDAEAESEDV